MRKTISRKHSKRLFRSGARTKAVNLKQMRGGIRL